MQVEVERWTCSRCLMSFRIEAGTAKSERQRCPECYKPFWAGDNNHHSRAVVGMEARP
jgi:protein-arginine kinase activator protein McsA